MTVISKKIGAVLVAVGCAMLLCLSCLCTTASAKNGGTIKLICQVRETPVKGMKWEAYRIGTFDGGKIILNEEFAKYPVDFSDLSTSAFADAASTLKDFVLTYKHNHKVAQSGVSDKNGEISLKNIEDGLYLIIARNYHDGVTTYIPTPAIVNLDSEENPELIVKVKIRAIATLSDTVEKFSVKKIWENDENYPMKPTEIVVDIYKDYMYYETVSLTEENDWYYEWHDEVDVEWSVIERKIPEECCVVYRNDGRNYVVVNTYVPDFEFDWEANFPPPDISIITTTAQAGIDTQTTTRRSFPLDSDEDSRTTDTNTTTTVTTDTDTTTNNVQDNDTSSNTTTDKTPQKTTTTTKKLPQTGQLWWPVPVMAIGGLVLIAVGTKIIGSSKRDEDE